MPSRFGRALPRKGVGGSGWSCGVAPTDISRRGWKCDYGGGGVEMKLPTHKLQIGIGSWKHQLVPADDPSLGSNSGDLDPKRRVISIDNTLLRADVAETSLHEVLHAILHDRPIQGLGDKREEAVVEVYAPGLFQVFRDNPKWARWILREAVRSKTP